LGGGWPGGSGSFISVIDPGVVISIVIVILGAVDLDEQPRPIKATNDKASMENTFRRMFISLPIAVKETAASSS